MNKLINKSFSLLLLLIGTLSLASCDPAGPAWNDELHFKGFTDTVKIEEDAITLKDNEFHTAKQLAYISSTWDTYQDFAYGKKEYSIPRGVKITLNNEADNFVQYSKTADFSSPMVASLYQHEPYLKNLEAGQKYYYRTSEDETFTGEAHEITVSNSLPRNMEVLGVTNVRDLGGYQSKLGGTIKQGMYYRGGRLNHGSATPVKEVTKEGYKTLTQIMKVKTELDLRSDENETGHMNNEVFPDIEYKNIQMTTYDVDNLMLEFKPQIKEAFKLFADENNYPFYVHCKIGTDRTGVISYLMGALLGMKNDDLTRDYLFSNFGSIGSIRNQYVIEENYYNELKKYGEPTLQLCTEAFLRDTGVSQEEIDAIKDIMIEK